MFCFIEYVNEEDLCKFDVVVFITHPGVRPFAYQSLLKAYIFLKR